MFVAMYHPDIPSTITKPVEVALQSVDDHAARGWLLVDPGAELPTPATPYYTTAAADSRFVQATQLGTKTADLVTAGTGALPVALRAASVTAVEDADEVTPTGAWDFATAPTVAGVALGTGGGGSVPDATSTTKGIVELATVGETTTGTDTARAVTPAGVKAALDAAIAESGAGTASWATDLAVNSYISHRNECAVYPEDTIEGIRGAIVRGIRAIKVDVFQLGDGAWVLSHDTTADRVFNATGDLTRFTAASVESGALNNPAGQRFAPAWSTLKVTFLEEVFRQFGGRAVFILEPKQGGVDRVAALLDVIASFGLQDSTVLTWDFNFSGVGYIAQCSAAGVASCPYWNSAAPTTDDIATVLAAQPTFVGVSQNNTDAAITSVVSAAHTAGRLVHGFTINRRTERDRMRGLGIDVIQANDVVYVTGTTGALTADQFALGGFVPGEVSSRTGQRTSGNPALLTWTGPPGGYRRSFPLGIAGADYELLGFLSPVANPSAFTVTATMTVEDIDTDATRWGSIAVGAVDDYAFGGGNSVNVYHCLMRQNGQIQVWKLVAGAATNGLRALGSSSQLGTTTTSSPMQIPVLSGALTAGAAITSLPVAALAQPVVIGHRFLLPTGQVAVASAAAAASATAITVTSITPSAAVPSGTALPQVVPLSVQVTATQVIFKRTDTGETCTVTDSSYRGGYVHIGKQGSSTTENALSWSNIAVA